MTSNPTAYVSSVTRWEKKWIKATENPGPLVTLGAKIGNNSKPAPNNYLVYKWVANPDLPPISLYDEPKLKEEDQEMKENTDDMIIENA